MQGHQSLQELGIDSDTKVYVQLIDYVQEQPPI